VTAREGEVLTLLADRLTNREIADRLFVSVRTVETHVSSLLAKLGAANRRELAAAGRALVQTPDAQRRVLPVSLTSFVGRARELAQLEHLLDTSRLVTVVGPAGAGKTRLALEAARPRAERHRDGVCMAELAPLAAHQVADEVLAALGGAQTANTAPLDALVRFAAPMDVFLVVDNCEHVIEEAANVVRALLEGAPGARVLATSRAPLAIPGEVVDRLGPLPLGEPATDPMSAALGSDAVHLFVDRVRSARADFELTPENAADVIEVCRRLDGLPLALELAASWSATFQPSQLVEQLDERLPLLRTGRRPGPAHQETLEAAINWSYVLLTDAERELFSRLSVFPASFSLDAARGICAGEGMDEAEVVELLAGLVDQSLVVPDMAGRANRYRMLESIREFGSLRLDGELQHTLERRLVEHMVALADELEPGLRGHDQDRARTRLQHDHDSLRRALELSLAQGDPEAGLRMLAATSQYWQDTDRRRELIEWFERFAAADRSAARREVPRSVLLRAALARAAVLYAADLHAARRVATEALALARAGDDEVEVAHALILYGMTRGRDPVHREEDHELLLDVAAQFRRAGEPWHAAQALWAACFVPDPETILGHLADARALYSEAGDRFRLVAADVTIALVMVLHRGDPDRARVHAMSALELARQIGSAHEETHARLALAELDLQQGGDTRAVLEECLETFRRFADHRCAGRLLALLGSWSLRHDGVSSSALERIREALSCASLTSDPVAAGEAFDALAIVAARTDPLAAVRLHASAAAQRSWEQIPANPSGLDWSIQIAELRDALGPSFERAWAEGLELDLEQAISAAWRVA
jgi:predicted ATPase/DNA-binding CsgD family transcriptional regulator